MSKVQIESKGIYINSAGGTDIVTHITISPRESAEQLQRLVQTYELYYLTGNLKGKRVSSRELLGKCVIHINYNPTLPEDAYLDMVPFFHRCSPNVPNGTASIAGFVMSTLDGQIFEYNKERELWVSVDGTDIKADHTFIGNDFGLHLSTQQRQEFVATLENIGLENVTGLAKHRESLESFVKKYSISQ